MSAPSAARARGALVVFALACLAALSGGCLTEVPAAERGAELFRDPDFSTSSVNEVSCVTCHATTATVPANVRLPGATMWGVSNRRQYWGGQETRLRDAVDQCLMFFMRSRRLDPDDLDARALHEYLASLGPDAPGTAQPFTVVERIVGLPDGDATRGGLLWEGTCQTCHGKTGSGDGRLRDLDDQIFPEYVTGELAAAFPEFPVGEVVIEKVRHGGFITTAGVMPLFSLESLSDDELADIVAYLGVRSLADE